VTGCATTRQQVPVPANTKFFSGRAEIFDKKKNKNERIRFYLASSSPQFCRIDVSVGALNISLGTLLLRGEAAQFVNLLEGKDYRSEDGSRALERLLKAKITPQQIVALFSEEFPLPSPWQCRTESANHIKCENVELFLDLKRDQDQRVLKIESERSSITMEYKVDKKRKVSFEWLSPDGFEKVTL
jgi:hypothetical protein